MPAPATPAISARGRQRPSIHPSGISHRDRASVPDRKPRLVVLITHLVRHRAPTESGDCDFGPPRHIAWHEAEKNRKVARLVIPVDDRGREVASCFHDLGKLTLRLADDAEPMFHGRLREREPHIAVRTQEVAYDAAETGELAIDQQSAPEGRRVEPLP